jgi:hypothetical protein
MGVQATVAEFCVLSGLVPRDTGQSHKASQ